MNERIDEILWQAGGYTTLSYPDDSFLDGRYALTQEQLDKFAELIVRECVEVCLAQRDPANLNYKPSEKFAEAVKQHFGVK